MPKETFFNLPEDKRQTILELAIGEFADHDFRSASISRIVERAGIAKGSFYQYFEDKRDLYFYLIELALQEKRAFLEDHEPPDPRMDIFSYISWLAEIGVRFQFSNPRLAQLGYRAVYTDPVMREEVYAHASAAGNAFFRQLIEQGIAQGDIDPNIDAGLAAYVLGTLFNGLGNYIFQQLGIEVEAELESGQNLLQVHQQPVQDIFDGLLHLLKYGMGSQNLQQKTASSPKETQR